MRMQVTPYAMDLRRADPMATLALPHRHVVLAADGYAERATIEVEAEDEHAACEAAWTRFQNIDEERLTPDGGRSLMTGDLARVADGAGGTSWWICCSIGWAPTAAPGREPVHVDAERSDRAARESADA